MSASPAAARPVDPPPGGAAGRAVQILDRLLVLGSGVIAVACLLVIGVTLAISVALRYLSGTSLPFATELPTFLFPWLVCAGIVAAAGAGGHLAVDYFVERMPATIRRVVRTVMWLLVFATLAYITVSAVRLMDSFGNQSTPILGWPAVLSYVSFPAALVALAVHALGRATAAFLGLPSPAGFIPEAELVEHPS